MLYDNAQLTRVYLPAWHVTHDDFYRRNVEQTFDYVAREMTHPRGGFFSSTDADSEGEEGKFFVWTPDEIREELGPDAQLFMDAYGVTGDGNFVEDPAHGKGKNTLCVARDLDVLAAMHKTS